MNLLQISHYGAGQIQVSWQRGKMIPRHYPKPLPLTDPLTTYERKELRWYLEEYLQFPYGAERDRAQRIETRMAAWGESLFKQVFPKSAEDPDPRGFYQEAVREGLERCEIYQFRRSAVPEYAMGIAAGSDARAWLSGATAGWAIPP